jgi:hypothetical protein
LKDLVERTRHVGPAVRQARLSDALVRHVGGMRSDCMYGRIEMNCKQRQRYFRASRLNVIDSFLCAGTMLAEHHG